MTICRKEYGMENYFKRENIFLDFDANDRKDFLSKISKILFEKK